MKAILFDMDGVLVDSHDAWFNRFNAALKNFGFNRISVDEFNKNIWAINFAETIGEYFPGITADQIRNFYSSRFCEFTDGIRKIRNAGKILKYVKEKGYKTAVVSNTQSNIARDILGRRGLLQYFDAVVGGDMVKKGKPDPEMLVLAAKKLKVKPEECIMVGDTVYDKEAAEKAGTGFIHYGKDVKDLFDIREML